MKFPAIMMSFFREFLQELRKEREAKLHCSSNRVEKILPASHYFIQTSWHEAKEKIIVSHLTNSLLLCDRTLHLWNKTLSNSHGFNPYILELITSYLYWFLAGRTFQKFVISYKHHRMLLNKEKFPAQLTKNKSMF